MAPSTPTRSGSQRLGFVVLLGLALALLATVLVWQLAVPLPGSNATATGSPGAQTAPPSAVVVVPTPTATSAPPTAPTPAPTPAPPMVPGPLTGLPVSPEAAIQRVIAVMVDDDVHARPQSGFNAADVVWQAPAEGGVPRYMMIFQDRIPAGVGPVRSARQYYIEWAAEWRAMYVHHGGSPQAKATLFAKGSGQWVYNADGFRWTGQYLWRTTDRLPPHNVYTDGANLRKLATRVHAPDGPIKPIWTFGPARAQALRPSGATITVVYPYETITYRYDAATNRYVRYINASATPQVDGADGQVVAPTNVVILRMRFGPLNDGAPNKHRLEAWDVGKGEAWIATNGVTIKGTWKKKSPTAPTLLYGADGKVITLTAGQTFVQVLPLYDSFTISAGVPSTWQPPMQARAVPLL